MATISFTTQFNLSSTPKKFVFVDTSDYAGQGITTSNVNGCFKITSPSGIVIYNNVDFSNSGCDVRVSVSTTNQTTISLPIGIDSLVEPGVYTILYTVKDITASPVFYTVTNSYTYSYTSPTVGINQTINLVVPLFTSIDTTSYPIAGATYTLTRVHTLYYPVGSAGAGSPTISSSQTIPVSVFYNGTQTTSISSTLTYTFSDGLMVHDIVTGSQEILVNDYDICTMSCCIRSMEEQLAAFKLTDTAQYNLLLPQFNLVMAYVGLINLSIECGLTTNIPGYITTIQTLTHCTDACSGCSDEGSQVVGMGITNLDVVVAAGTGISVTPVTVGSTTTYTVSLGSSWITLINSLYNTVVAAGPGVTVVPSGPVSNTITYTVSSLVNTSQSTNDSVGKTLSVGNMKLMTTDMAVGVTGTYLSMYEADIETGAADTETDFNYSFMKNGSFASISQVARFDLTGLDNPRLRICLTDIISLTATDTLNIWGEVLGGGDGGGDAAVSHELIRIVRIA